MPKFRKKIGVGGFRITAREKRLVNEVLASGRLSYGSKSQEFERRVAALHEATDGVFCSSGSAALHLALASLAEQRGWKPGDHVIIPALSFIAVANIVRLAGFQPVLADIDPSTFNISSADLHRTSRTRCVIPVHSLGLAADMDAISTWSRKTGVAIVEDACEAMFASVGGKPVGSWGDVTCFSTYASHTISTGVGGMAICRDAELASIMRSLINHGGRPLLEASSAGKLRRSKNLHERFSFERSGFSYRITEMEAALGIAQLERYESLQQRRRQIAARLRETVAQHPKLRSQHIPPGYEHSWMAFAIVARSAAIARSLRKHLEARHIETRPLFPLQSQKAVAGVFAQDKPIAADLSSRGLYIGCHPELTNTDVDYICKSIHSFFSKAPGRV